MSATVFSAASESELVEVAKPAGNHESSSGSIYASLLQALIQTVGPSGTATNGTVAAGAAAATAGTPATAASIAIQGLDVQDFLHQLFAALRQAGASHKRNVHPGGAMAPPMIPTPGFAAALAAAPEFAPRIAAAPVAGSPASTAIDSDAASPYRQQDVISALQSLVTDLGISQEIRAGFSSGLSSSTSLSLNAAFTKLMRDLNGAAATSANPGTAALQSFLGTFLQHLKTNQVSAANALGGTVNATV